jgi:ESCRT-II complex subunit VPS22
MLTKASFAQIATAQSTQQLNDLTTQLQHFQSALQTFAQNHAEEIRSNATFRSEFARMCSAIGVDPLVGSGSAGKRRRGWGLLGVGEFWLRVAVRTVSVCRRTREEYGGFISVREVQGILAREDKLSKSRTEEISEYVLRYWRADIGMIL